MIQLDGNSLTLDQLRAIADGELVGVAPGVHEKVTASNRIVEKLVEENRVVYGITTGFGHLCNTHIDRADLERLQTNLIRSHATGVGDFFTREEVRAMIAIRVNSLLHGVSGVRMQVIESLLGLINKDVIPCVPQQGSVGSSGDLAPLSHIMLVLMGEGEVLDPTSLSRCAPAAPALAKAGLSPLSLKAKEGLALINGTAVMTGVFGLALERALVVAKTADLIGGMTLEVLKGSTAPFDPEFIALRPYPGMKNVAANVVAVTADSAVCESHIGCTRVQDAYSLRCIPQVHGATREALNHLVTQVTLEMNAVTDNPILLSEDKIISGGHFHGQPMALTADYFGISISELGNISERRIDRLLNPLISGLNPFLTANPGVNSGLMIVQYTAASLVSENKILAHPASVDSIPTSAYQEDHVSMGTIAARKGARILDHVTQVLAIELICAAQAYEYVKPLALGKGTGPAYEFLRRSVLPLTEDRVMTADLAAAKRMIGKGELLNHVEQYVKLR
ncbi:MAG: histidine ammonia-lyase [Candidatus Riflebacteria bacterium]|nr:histidine ammonia-lyase [Candidatus Riflebacteria bacterium]